MKNYTHPLCSLQHYLEWTKYRHNLSAHQGTMLRDARQRSHAAFVPLPSPEVLGLKHESHMSLWMRTEWSNARIAGSGINEHPKDSSQQMGRIHFRFHNQLELGTFWWMYPSWFHSTWDTCVYTWVCTCMFMDFHVKGNIPGKQVNAISFSFWGTAMRQA